MHSFVYTTAYCKIYSGWGCVCVCFSFRTGSRNTGVRPKIMLANDQANTHKASQVEVESHAFMTLRFFVNKTHECTNVPE